MSLFVRRQLYKVCNNVSIKNVQIENDKAVTTASIVSGSLCIFIEDKQTERRDRERERVAKEKREGSARDREREKERKRKRDL